MDQPILKRSVSTLVLGGISSAIILLTAAVIFPALSAFMLELARIAAESGDSIPQLNVFLTTLSTLATIYYVFAIINAGLTVLAYFKRFGAVIFSIYNIVLFILNGFVLFLIPFILNIIAANKAKRAFMKFKLEKEAYEKFSKEEVTEQND